MRARDRLRIQARPRAAQVNGSFTPTGLPAREDANDPSTTRHRDDPATSHWYSGAEIHPANHGSGSAMAILSPDVQARTRFDTTIQGAGRLVSREIGLV